jgi:hypothetical protein
VCSYNSDEGAINRHSRHTQDPSPPPLPSTSDAADDVLAGNQGEAGYTSPHIPPTNSGTPPARLTTSTSATPKASQLSRASHRTFQRSGNTIDIPSLPRPSTPNVLSQNISRLIRHIKPIPTLPAVVDYHASFPELHSTHSYNLLLAFAIDHAAYAVFRSILDTMRAALIPRNLQTSKLEIRYLVHTDSWDQAWKRAQEHPCHPQPSRGEEIPLPVWLEMFGMPRKAHVRQSERGMKQEEDDHPPEGTRLASRQESKTWNRRLRLLLDSAPAEMTDFAGVDAYTIRSVVWCLLRLQYREEALSITEAYFRSLPLTLTVKDSARCTAILNLHVSFGALGKGLAKFNATQTILQSLFDANPALRPDSNTLFLLLGPLRHAKWCATKAQSVVKEFCARWGDGILDNRVKRRVVTLALKGGRPDIAEMFTVPRDELKGDEEDSSQTTPMATRRELFGGVGKERVLSSRARTRVKSAGRHTEDTSE